MSPSPVALVATREVPHMEHEAPPTGGPGTTLVRLGWKGWLRLGTMYLLGWVLATLVGFAMLFTVMAAEPGIAHFVLLSLFTAGTAAVIWVTSHSLLKRGLAAGVASAWLFTPSLVFVWHP